jgi:prepilin-type N-terminal cleavage/methylation domain-containing protein
MPVTRQSAFTLIEMIVVIVVLMIVVGLGIWCIGLLRQDAQSAASSNILATVQRMQQLSDLNGLTQSQTDPCNGSSSCKMSLPAPDTPISSSTRKP